MAEIDGGGLHFKSVMDNDQMNAAIEETLRRVQGLSDGTVTGGKAMDNAFNTTADNIRKTLSDIGTAIYTHEQELQSLESEYESLGAQASKAFMSGRDDEFRAITQQQNAVQGEITVRKKLIKELQEQSSKLDDVASKMEEAKRKAEENANAQVSMRARIRELKEEMMLMIDQGIDEQSEAYKRLVAELGRLQDIQGDVAQQGKMLANDEQQFQGIITGLSGLAGGFSAATGAVSLFAGENEDLQKVMTKVQSVMAITIGMQQVAQTLNKDSAFQLIIVTKLKEWWRNVVIQATAAENTETVATTANTAAQKANATATGAATGAQAANTAATGAQATAATAGTVANIGLAGAFRLVGVAIKSIPVFGWVLAGISSLIGLVAIFSKKAREAKKEQEEFSKALIEGAYKPIGIIESLSVAYSKLGDNLESKKKFIEQNKKSFDELGVAVNDVADVENLLVKNKDAFIDAQIAKAKAAIYLQQSMEKVKKQMQLEQEISKMSDTKTVYASYGMYGGGYTYETENKAKTKKKKELEELKAEIKQGYQNAADEEYNGYNILQNAGIDGVNTYKVGTIGAIEQAISQKQAALKLLTSNEDYKKELEEIANLQKQLEGITGKSKQSSTSGKDPFLEKLDKYKKEYTRFNKWVNSGDATLVKAANTEFQGLLKQGATYIEYLKNQRDVILSIDIASRTKAQNKQLQALNDQIAEETKKTVLEAFNTELSEQLNNAKTTLEILNIIAQKRKELANDGTDLDNTKKDTLDDAEKNALAKQKQETDQLLQEYSSYLDKKIQLETEYSNDLALLEKRRSQATTDAERTKIDQAIANRSKQYEKDSKGSGDTNYDEMLNAYGTFEQKKQAIIDEYDAKRETAQEHGNEEMIAKLNEAQAKAISALASDELMGTEVWANLFGNLDELTARQITTLVTEIESKFDSLSGVFNPVDLTSIRNKLNEAKAVLVKDNPFKQMGESLKAIFNDAGDDSKDSAQKIKKNWKQLAESTEKSFDFVADAVNSADFLKDAIGDVGATAISSMATVASVAIAVSTAIKTAEKSSVILAIIQAALVVVQAVINVISAIAGNKDKQIEKNIQKHADAVDRLEAAYTALSWAIDKALGGDVYKNQQAAIANMEAQREHLQSMWRAEESKKKTDSDKVKEYKEQYEQSGRDIEDMLDNLSDDILQTDAKSFANELGDALVEAFSKGEDAATAFGDTVDNVIKQAVINQLKKTFLEKQLQGALDGLEKSMGYWNGNEFVFDGLTDAEIAAFKNQVSNITSQFNQAMEAYSDIFKDIVIEDENTSLTGSIKGVSEETASLVAGQMNAIRVNQLESTTILRQQLMYLATIAQNTSYNHFLQDIDSKLDKLTDSSDPLRSKGLS